MKIICISCAIALLLGIFKFPIEYYTFLRIVVSIGATIILFGEFKKELNIWLVLFGILVILFNPILPIYLYKKSLWVPIDIAAALLFICYTLKNRKMFSKSFSFDGRIGRTEYCISTIIHIITYCILAVIIKENNEASILVLVFIPLFWFIWAQGAKRCHDLGQSGWMQLIPFYVLWMFFQEGNYYSNSYGENPNRIETINTAQAQPLRTSVYLPIANTTSTITIPENQVTMLEVSNVNYSLIQDILKNLRKLESVKNQSYTFLENTATITVNHKNTSQALLDSLYSIMENIEVLSVGSGFITIKIK